MRAEREISLRRIHNTNGKRICIRVNKDSYVILKLAEHIETATRYTFQKNGTSGFHKPPPRLRICTTRIRIEPVSDDRVASGTQHDSQAFAERRQSRSVVHQRWLQCAVILDPSAIIKIRIIRRSRVGERL